MSAKPDPAEVDAAFDRLVEEHGRRVGLFLAQLVRDRELAEDLLQETLLAAFKTLLYRYSEQDDIIIGSPTAGRHGGVENLIGLVVEVRDEQQNALSLEVLRHLVKRRGQVAGTLGCSTGTVKSQTARGLAALRAAYQRPGLAPAGSP